MAQRYGDIEFGLCGRDVDKLAEGVTQFKYLGRNLDQYNNNWPYIYQSIRRARILGTAEKGTEIGGGIYPSVRNFLLGCGASGSVVRLRIVGHVGGDVDNGGGKPYNIPKEYHR